MGRAFLLSSTLLFAFASCALADESICAGSACDTDQPEGMEMLQKKSSAKIHSGLKNYDWYNADCTGVGSFKRINGDDPAAQRQCTSIPGCAGWSVNHKTGVRRLMSQDCKMVATGKWIYFKKMGGPPGPAPTPAPTRPPTTCKPINKYWTGELAKAKIQQPDINKLCTKEGQWYYDDAATEVGFGGSKETCDGENLKCRTAGGKSLNGYSDQQSAWVKHAIFKLTCTTNKYWREKLAGAGIKQSEIDKVCTNPEDGQWYYDGIATKVGFGKSTDPCNETFQCREKKGKKLNGHSDQQVAWVKAAIANGGVYPDQK
mmetsp:Transcript_122013/g.223667  ORF Transcript_122013/g.223667 Transcript_122013/m.223667 type:complete len:316 (+) Transcript_122013:2-949(+)